MFCILEGCDGSGKSTFANELIAELNERGLEPELLHRGVPERDVLDEYQHDVEDFRPGGVKAIVADRWHWGDIVYGELYRGSSFLGGTAGAGFRFVELFLMSRGAVTVLVTNSEDEIRRRLQSRGEDYLKDEHISHVLKRYDEVFESSVTGVLRTDAPDLEEVLVRAEFWSGQAEALNPFPTYVGGRTPRVLLVGEKRGDPETPSVTAFRPTSSGNSAEWLLKSLPDSLWRSVGMCNALEEPDLPALLDVLADPPVIALGHEASKHLTSLGIEHAGLPHPQYMRRFRSGDQHSLNYGQKVVAMIGSDRKEFSWPR